MSAVGISLEGKASEGQSSNGQVAPGSLDHWESGEGREVLDVVVVGAGVSGIAVGAYLNRKAPWARYVVLEARDSIGGTWDLFRYPGIRSDSDMYTFSFSFNPWKGDKAIADGKDILAYLKETARNEGVEDKIRYRHRVSRARWSSEEGLWRISVEAGGREVEMLSRFLVGATGYYRYDHGYQPEFPGLVDYEGVFVHPQHWPEDLDWTDKRVLVIGSGATAITLVPSLAERARSVVMLQRSPTYVFPRPGQDPLSRWAVNKLPGSVHGPVLRWMNALFLEWSYRYSKKHPEKMKALFRAQLKRQLPAGFEVDKHFKPAYNPWDQRLCIARDGDLFKAIRAGKVTVVTDHIDTFTAKGVKVRSGEEIEADIVVSATGLELLFLGGIELEVDGEAVCTSEVLSYKGMMLDGVPNAVAVTGYINNSWTLKAELTADFLARLLNHMRAKGKAVCVARANGVQPSDEPLLNLSSGYVKRGAPRLPKQGVKDPWRLSDSYVKDWARIKLLGLRDPSLVLRNGVKRPIAHPGQSSQHKSHVALSR